MQKFRCGVVLLGFLMMHTSALAETNNSPLWLTDTPQSTTSSATDSFSLEDQLFHFLNSKLSTPFSVVQANNRRAEAMLKNQLNACTGNKLKTAQRINNFQMTELPQSLFLGQRIYSSNPEAKSKLDTAKNNNNQVQLKKLIQQNPQLILGLEDGRSYGNQVDAIINSLNPKTQLYRRHDQGTAKGIIDMLLSGRIDLIIEYPAVLHHYMITSPITAIDLQSSPVAELESAHAGYIMCANSPQGKKLVQELDKVIATASQQRQYLELHLKWNEKSTHQELINLYNTTYKTQF